MDVDRYDLRILAELQRDGRLSVVELAETIGLSPTPCARRIKALESAGAIEGYTAVLSPRGIGLEVLAMVQVKLTEHTDETVARFEKEIALLDEVTHCYALTGTYDFLLQVYGKDLDSLSNVVLKRLIRIPNVRDLHSSVVLETVKTLNASASYSLVAFTRAVGRATIATCASSQGRRLSDRAAGIRRTPTPCTARLRACAETRRESIAPVLRFMPPRRVRNLHVADPRAHPLQLERGIETQAGDMIGIELQTDPTRAALEYAAARRRECPVDSPAHRRDSRSRSAP